jgi:hypothetical protein
MRTVSVEAVCAPARGERINRRGVDALVGFAAVPAWVVAGARVAVVVVEVPPPQPLAMRTKPKLTQTDPALNALVTTLLASGRGNLGWQWRFTYLLMTPFFADPSSNGRRKVMELSASWLIRITTEGAVAC